MLFMSYFPFAFIFFILVFIFICTLSSCLHKKHAKSMPALHSSNNKQIQYVTKLHCGAAQMLAPPVGAMEVSAPGAGALAKLLMELLAIQVSAMKHALTCWL